MIQPLVSVIIPTRNAATHIRLCIESLKNQTYRNIEMIIIDDFSKDDTINIIKSINGIDNISIYNQSTNMAAARNYGAKRARGMYLLFIDSDMELTPNVIENCINNINTFSGIIIPEVTMGNSFFTRIRTFERSFYIGADGVESARFYNKESFFIVDGYDESLYAYEDRDLPLRMQQIGLKTNYRINSIIIHHEENKKFFKHIKKVYTYNKLTIKYINKNPDLLKTQLNPIYRLSVFINPHKILEHPILFISMISLKTFEFSILIIASIVNIFNKGTDNQYKN